LHGNLESGGSDGTCRIRLERPIKLIARLLGIFHHRLQNSTEVTIFAALNGEVAQVVRAQDS
jgi:hypothetical protein